MSKEEKFKPFYFRVGETITPLGGTGYRLPSEAEWEFACRAGTSTKYWIGDEDEDLVRAGWFNGNAGGRPHAGGELKANPFGLFDIHGNVWEWVQDVWDATYYGQFGEQTATNPPGPLSTGSQHVFRGGNWYDPASFCRSSNRHAFPEFRDSSIGFRVSLLADAVKEALKREQQPVPNVQTGWHGWPADAPAPAIAPFDAAQAKQHQQAWADYLKLPVEYKNSLGMKFVLIPPGEFTMGSTPEEIEAALKDAGENKHWQECIKSETPQHKVILTQAIYLGVNEVTQKEYEAVMQATPSHFASTGPGKEAVANLETQNHPVETVSWNDATEFCEKLSEKEELKPFYFRSGETITPLEGTGYRLPTEAEWEFACRAGTTTKYWIGDQDDDLVQAGWFGRNSGGRTHAAGELRANSLGLSDMHGNVWEWVQDWWEPTYYGQFAEKPAINPSSPSSAGSQRVLRGGDWFRTGSHCRSSSHDADVPAYRYHSVGFRVSLPVDAVKGAIQLPPTFKNSLGMEFVIVPKGKSWLGGGKDKLGDKEVEIPADFYLGKYEVTQEEWEKVMGENPSHFSRTGDGKDAVKDILDAELKRFPVETVSWDQCQIFVEKLNKLEKQTGWVYRLPKEVEWEYACRGGPMSNKADSAFDFYFAKPTNNPLREQATIGKNKGPNRTTKVGSYEANRLGLFDMHRNVWEWCDDMKEATAGDTRRVHMGGGWTGLRWTSAAGHFETNLPSRRSNTTGLRLARVPSGAPSPEAKAPPLAVAPLAVAPFTDADVERIAALPAAEQVEEVRKELMRRNPGFDGKVEHKIEGDVVTELKIVTDKLMDISPIRAFGSLRVLECDLLPERDAEILRSIKTLEKINGKPAAEFWKEVEQK